MATNTIPQSEEDTTMYTIRRTQIIGTNQLVFTAWEPMAAHSCVMLSEKLGQVTSRRLPAELEQLTGEARFALVTEWLEQLKLEAVQAILAEYPWLAEAGYVSGGQILATTDQEAAAL